MAFTLQETQPGTYVVTLTPQERLLLADQSIKRMQYVLERWLNDEQQISREAQQQDLEIRYRSLSPTDKQTVDKLLGR